MDPKTVEGVIIGVEFTPGRTDGMITVTLDGGGQRVMIFAGESRAELTWDGTAIDLPTLMFQLVTYRARVVAYPIAERYGAATKADFTTRH